MPGAESERPRFHLAVPVDDLDAARSFYGGVMGCPEGRSAPTWVDFDLYGHQFVVHLDPNGARGRDAVQNHVDGDEVPVPHFGLLLSVEEWEALADRFRAAGSEFVIQPHVRFAGEAGEQHTMFLRDPAGNALEFKAFADEATIFAV
jgi:extradiol dioxygenase family protein